MTLIIAEAGVNHNGDMSLAKSLIRSASEAGADIVKFQSFVAGKLVTINAQKASYQKVTTDQSESQFEMLKKLELSDSDHLELLKECDKNNIEFLSTAFDLERVHFLNNLKLKRFKIPSGEITNLPYLKAIGKLNKPIILSTGMATLAEIEDAILVLLSSGAEKENITILHCTTAYPTLLKEVNLKAMTTISKAFKVKVGYSDHTKGIDVAIAATALGAEIIEKHLTLDKKMNGPDHLASIEPNEFNEMVTAIRNIENALGNGIKLPTQIEKENALIARKSIVASKTIKKGEIFNENNICAKRPGTGISPMKWEEIIGKYAYKDFNTDDLIEI